MDTVLSNDDGSIINFGAPSATDEILAFHYGDFDDAYGDGTVADAATNGRVYANTDPGDLPEKFGTIAVVGTASGQTTYTWTPPTTSLQANVLLVAGGGGGGFDGAGGGGGGGVTFQTGVAISGAKTIVVGNGGSRATAIQVAAQNGFNSSAFGFTSSGGGGGGSKQSNGASGASGGGGGHPTGYTGGTGTAGGNGGSSSADSGGGGGGASGANGENGGTASGGRGGDGFLASVFGENYGESGWFGGGGGGGTYNFGTGGQGGAGGGGTGGDRTLRNGEDGESHTGGGGGSAGNAGGPPNAGNGGSGVVLVRYIVDTTVIVAKNLGALDVLGSSVYTSVDAAYSLRRLFLAYTGPQVRVRRSTDNAETDVYFSSDGSTQNLNLTTWLGGATAYVTTWYDQSGDTKHLTQTTTSLQPQLQLDGSNYKIYFNGSNVLEHPDDPIFNSVEQTIVARSKSTGTMGDWMNYVSKMSSSSGRFFTLWYESNHNRMLYQRYGTTSDTAIYDVGTGGHLNVTRTVVARTNSSSTMSYYVDGALRDTGSGSFTPNTGPFLVGGSTVIHQRFLGYIENVMVYTSALDDATSEILSYPATLL